MTTEISLLIIFSITVIHILMYLKGKIVRREDHLGEEFVVYGIEFQNLSRQAQLELSKFINNKTKVTAHQEFADSI